MKDFNFFSIYSKKKDVSSSRLMLTGIIAGGVLAVALVLYGGLLLYNSWLNNEAVKTEAFLATPEVSGTFDSVEQCRTNISLLNSYNSIVDKITPNLSAGNYFGINRMKSLNAVLPQNVSMERIYMSGTNMMFEFTAPDLVSAAALADGISSLDFFEEIHPESIVTVEGITGYYVSIAATLKGGAAE